MSNRAKSAIALGGLLLAVGAGVLLAGRHRPSPPPLVASELPQPVVIIAKRLTDQECEAKTAPDEKKKCWNEIRIREASVHENIELCLTVDDYQTRQECIARGVKPLKSEKECARIADRALRDDCLEFIGIASRDVKFCDRFGDEPFEKKECIDRITAFKQEDSPDINACTNVTTLEYNFLC